MTSRQLRQQSEDKKNYLFPELSDMRVSPIVSRHKLICSICPSIDLSTFPWKLSVDFLIFCIGISNLYISLKMKCWFPEIFCIGISNIYISLKLIVDFLIFIRIPNSLENWAARDSNFYISLKIAGMQQSVPFSDSLLSSSQLLNLTNILFICAWKVFFSCLSLVTFTFNHSSSL